MHPTPAPDLTGWHAHPVTPDVRVRATRAMPPLTGPLEAEVERLWRAAQARTGGALFNGRVFSADAITPGLVTGHWTEYRRVAAQMERPDLHAELAVRPLSVGGLIGGPDGVVMGRRPVGALYQSGMWQLPPAGSIDQTAADEDGWVDPPRQLLTELREELGLPAGAVHAPRPLCIVEHPGSHVLDLGIALTTTLTAADIQAAHRAGGNGEYDPLLVVPSADLAAFIARAGNALTPQALFFLRAAGTMIG